MIHLPIEIWSKIFKNLSATDLINFCEAFKELEYLLTDKSIVKKFDVQGNYRFVEVDFVKFIKEKVQYDHIRSLNINNLYWVPLKDLRSLLSLLTKLEELFALETNLSLREKDVKLYGNLRVLAVCASVNDCNIDINLVKVHMFLLKRFCLKVTSRRGNITNLYRIFKELFALRELWIEDLTERPSELINYDMIVYKLQFLNKLVIKSKISIPFLDYKPVGMAKIFESRRFKSIVIIYVKCPQDKIVHLKNISIFDPFETQLEIAWDVLRRFYCEMPYDVKAAEKIYMTRNVKDAQFEELNFCHNKCFCNINFITATWDFLKAPNSRNLKKLCIKSCVLQRKPPPTKDHVVENLERIYPFQDIVENCSKLEELEIMSCSSCNVTIADCYMLINQLVNLERLTVEVPIFVNGNFLIKVIQNCKKLKYLKVLSCGTNEMLNRNLSLALKDAKYLEDFSIESEQINLESLLEGLNEINSCKLRRIYVNCKHEDTRFQTELETLLKKNPQLILVALAIQIEQTTKKMLIRKILKEFCDNKAKYYYLYPTSESMSHVSLQHVHKDILQFNTNVSIVDLADFR
ncbi:uncharacterized protein LOC115877506 isoform X2 [Sitophilus oryzae]|uniref:Uncharacterized protein LOC115877506 isoform X2 n=1 Tax=Sitophilus oryzae TaxID=7048 RepID=A0A6J2XE16_SITOR|nr:uncharacterized protein LOC115877506 isoform X2 [Sitophilus oryzae]